MEHSTGYTVGFTAVVCLVCSVFVAGSAVSLKDRQDTNIVLDRQKKVLTLAGLMEEGEALSSKEVVARFTERVVPRAVNLSTGEFTDAVDPNTYDQRKAAKDPKMSHAAEENPAKVRRLPTYGVIFEIQSDDGSVETLIIPIEGKGLWSTLYGYLALSPDTKTIKGITFYEQCETPGLGGEVENPRWKALWKGRLAFDDRWNPDIHVIKGRAGPVASDPHRVDGLSGATMTSRGVDHLVGYWLGDSGFGPFLAKIRASES